MPSWGELLNETVTHKNEKNEDVPGLTLDELRLKYLTQLSSHTGRNVIAYYSGWLNGRSSNSDINDGDITGFMNAIKGLDCSKGLDLILHTPGGSPTACEGIVNYLHSKFGDDIRALVPQMAMSAGTMLSCATKEIVMGKHSCLGPIDPQYGGVPAYNILSEFTEAKKDLGINSNSKSFWELQLKKYPAAFFYTLVDAINLSSTLTGEWLAKFMFTNVPNDEKGKKISAIIRQLNMNNKSHSRHFSYDFCKSLGLNVKALEDDQDFQEDVLSVHHSYIITFTASDASKIIENQNGVRFVTHQR